MEKSQVDMSLYDRGMDMGASFIHHPDENNAIVKLHQQFNLPMLDWNNTRWAVVRENDSMPYNQARVDAASAKVDKAFEAVLNLSSTLQRDVSVYTALRHLHQYQLIDDPLSQTFVAEQEFFYGSTINYLSAKYLFDGYMENEAPDTPDKIPAFGYTKMLDRIIQSSPDDTPLNILLDHEVTEVNVQEDKRVIIKCRNGQIYEADAVIVTLPLGVLKANDVKFTPDLSTKKKGAIKRVGFGTINKFALEFSHRFWSKDTQQMTVAPQDIADRGKFSILITFHTVANKPVVMTYAVSQFGEDSEMLSDKELKDIGNQAC
ncbi:uncharacterized protein LOC135479772 [Liolophura sinensis]|uniref:uncharacterized protein LOC135479772 n=1 Tax=Liolophura sinensis TaxID=3198878 RepID=UPI003158E965